MEPRRLTLISMTECDFCDNPQNEKTHQMQYYLGYGCLCCSKCIPKCEETFDMFSVKQKGLGMSYMQYKLPNDHPLRTPFTKIKVKRTSGVIECDWEINVQAIMYRDVNEIMTPCCHSSAQISKNVRLKDLISHNPEIDFNIIDEIYCNIERSRT
jgi:hypothetical protein